MATATELTEVRYGEHGIGDTPTEAVIDALLVAFGNDTLSVRLGWWRSKKADILSAPATAALGGDASRTYTAQQLEMIDSHITGLEHLIGARDGTSAALATVPITRTDTERTFGN